MFPAEEIRVKSYLVPNWKLTFQNVTVRKVVAPAGIVVLVDVEAVPLIPAP